MLRNSRLSNRAQSTILRQLLNHQKEWEGEEKMEIEERKKGKKEGRKAVQW